MKSVIDLTNRTKRCGRCKEIKSLDDFYFWVPKQRWSGYCRPCNTAYEREGRAKRKELNPTAGHPRINVGECIVEGCTREQKSKHYCNAHWRQMRDNGFTTEIAEAKSSIIKGVDSHRICTYCDTIKPVEDFYKRTNGTLKSDCKVCSVKGTRYDALIRQKRYEEAAVLLESMPQRLREKKRKRLPNG